MDTPNAPASLDDRQQIETWIDEAKQGSTAALGNLLEACRLYLLETARRRTPPALAGKVSPSDLVQETSLAAHRAFPRFRGERLEELLAWLREILLCNAANARRRYQETDKREVAREIPLNGFSDVAKNLQDNGLSPRSLLLGDEERLLVEGAIERLSQEHRQVILLRSRDRLSFVDIGERMGRSPDAARKLWMRAVEQLERECDHGHG